jgi:tRNA pseudouridine38-40 synthase
MREAARLLVGEHDFSAFRSSECQAKTPVRTLHSLEIELHGERVDFVLRANAFLHHMVRNIVGTLVYVGKGKHPPAWAREVLDSRDRSRAAPTFGPEGLYLEKIEYEAKWGLPA